MHSIRSFSVCHLIIVYVRGTGPVASSAKLNDLFSSMIFDGVAHRNLFSEQRHLVYCVWLLVVVFHWKERDLASVVVC